MHINNPEVERKVRSLAQNWGTSLTETIDISVTKQLGRAKRASSDPNCMREIGIILDRLDRLPVLDTRSADEILGYTESGTFDGW